jgi:hypothetical protein
MRCFRALLAALAGSHAYFTGLTFYQRPSGWADGAKARLTACGSAAPARASAAAAGSAATYLVLMVACGAGAPRSRPSALRSSSTSGQ